MALNFPTSPEINDTYIADNGITYTFDGEKWNGQLSSLPILSSIDQSIIPDTDNTYDLGSPTNQWRDIFVSNGSIYVGNVKISNDAGRLVFTQVTNPGQPGEQPVPGGTEAFELPIASDTLLGGIKVGNNLSITEDGTLNAEDGNYTLPTASDTVKGGVKVGDNLSIDGEGFLSAIVPDVSSFITAEDIPAIPADVSDLTDTENLLSQGLPTASTTVLGGVKVDGTTVTITDGVISSVGGTSGDANVWVQTFESEDGAPTDVVGIAISVEYDSAGNVISLFTHSNEVSNNYYSVGKYTTTGTKIWTARFADGFDTDGWGLAVDNDSNSIYVAGESEAAGGLAW